MALVDGDIITSSFGDILTIDDNEDIIQTAVNNILTVKGDNILHPEIGNDAHNNRYKMSTRSFNEIAERCKEAILQDVRVDSVLEVLVVKDKYISNACNVSFVLVTTSGRQLYSGASITIY